MRAIVTSTRPRSATARTRSRTSRSNAANSRGAVTRTSRKRWFRLRTSTVTRAAGASAAPAPYPVMLRIVSPRGTLSPFSTRQSRVERLSPARGTPSPFSTRQSRVEPLPPARCARPRAARAENPLRSYLARSERPRRVHRGAQLGGGGGGRPAPPDDDARRLVREHGRLLERAAGTEREGAGREHGVAGAGHVEHLARDGGKLLHDDPASAAVLEERHPALTLRDQNGLGL